MGLKRGIKPMFQRGKWKILRGDRVMITAGKDKGQLGTVTKVIKHPQLPRVIVEGRNLNKRFIKRTEGNPGGVVAVESPLHYSNVRLVDPVTGKKVRTISRFQADGSKVRISAGKLASGSIIQRPEILSQRRRPTPLAGPKDTPLAAAKAPTYDATDFPEAWRPLLENVKLQSREQRAEKEAVRQAHARAMLARVAPALRRRPFSSFTSRPGTLCSLYSTFAAGPVLEQ